MGQNYTSLKQALQSKGNTDANEADNHDNETFELIAEKNANLDTYGNEIEIEEAFDKLVLQVDSPKYEYWHKDIASSGGSSVSSTCSEGLTPSSSTSSISSVHSQTSYISDSESPHPEPMVNDGRVWLNDFEVLKLLGNGSHGKVYLVRHKTDPCGKIYAMKVLKKKLVLSKGQTKQTKMELAIHTSFWKDGMNCKYIPKLYWAFHTEKRLYMIFEFCSGGELYYHIGQRGRIPINLARVYAAEIVVTLGYLHERGIIYRDFKPENLVLDTEGHLNLVDFGLCKVSNLAVGGKHQYEKERDGFVCGTTEYLAPEIIRSGHNSFAADWWAFGMVLFEMLTGLPPWYCYDQNKVVLSILHEKLKFPDYLSGNDLEQVYARNLIERLLTKVPESRIGGTSSSGFEEIMAHPFFDSINWDHIIERKVTPGFVPPKDSDICNFDTKFTSMKIDLEQNPRPCTTPDGFSDFCFDYRFCNRRENLRQEDMNKNVNTRNISKAENRELSRLELEQKQILIQSSEHFVRSF